jgi:hypothetical protein
VKPPEELPLAEVLEILDGAIEANEDAARKSVWIMSIRRRIKNALALLEENRVDEAKEMLKQALADDGTIMNKRMEKIVQKFYDEYAEHNT